MVAVQATSPILIVGDLGARLELELSAHGLACTVATTANDAVARMKTTRFPVVVVPPVITDMSGVDFIHGVLRHFDANVVLYGNGVDDSEVNALLRTGRVAHFPAHAEGHVVADFLARRGDANGSAGRNGNGNANGNGAHTATSMPPTPAPATTPVPMKPQGRQFNLTPGPPVATTPQPSMPPSSMGASMPPTPLSAALFGTGTPGTLSSASSQFVAPPHTAPFAVTPAPSLSTSFPPFPPAPPSMMPAGAAMAPSAQFERIVDDLARANAELVVLQGKLAMSEQERQAMAVEVEAARRSAMQQVAQVMALSDEGDPVQEELDALKNELAAAKNEYAMARAEADALRDERERLMGDVATGAQELAELRARIDQAEGAVTELALVRGELERQMLDIDANKNEIETVKIERNAIMRELEVVRGERDVARADIDAVRFEIEALKTANDEGHSNIDTLRLEKDALAHQVAGVEQERDAFADRLSTLETERDAAEAARASVEQRVAMLEAQRNELVNAVGDAQRKVEEAQAGSSDVEAALRLELEKLRTDVNAARTDATTVRLDLQEALMRLDEASAAMQAAQEERDALRAEAIPLREWANQVVAAHAEQQTELARLRALLDDAQSAQRTVDELRTQLQTERDKAASRPPAPSNPVGANAVTVVGGGSGRDDDLRARSRQLADLVRALEPFLWGLQQATGFFTKASVSGGEAHVKLLQQLQGVLLRLRDEIAKLDLG